MKSIKKSILIFSLLNILFLTVYTTKSKACYVEFEIQGEEKITYKIDETIELKVTVSKTHQNCNFHIENTEFELSGLKIIEQKEWEKLEAGIYECTLKMKVVSNLEGKLKVELFRRCGIGRGGFGSILLKAEVINN